jgi:hypothetical protein
MSFRGQLGEALNQVGEALANLEPGPNVSEAQIDRLQEYYFQLFDWYTEPPLMEVDISKPCTVACRAQSRESTFDWPNALDCLQLTEAPPSVVKDLCMDCWPCAQWYGQVSSTIGNTAQLLAELGQSSAAEVLASASEATLAEANRAAANLEPELPAWVKAAAFAAIAAIAFNWSK